MAEQDATRDSIDPGDERSEEPSATAGWVGPVLLTAAPFLFFGLLLLFDRLIR